MILLLNRLTDIEDDLGSGWGDLHRSQDRLIQVHSLLLSHEPILLGELSKNRALGSLIGATCAGKIIGDFPYHKQQQKSLFLYCAM